MKTKKIPDKEIIPRDQWRKDQITLQLLGKEVYVGDVQTGWARLSIKQARELRDDLVARLGQPTVELEEEGAA